MDGQNWRGLRWIALGKFEKRRPTFFKFMPVYIKISFTQRENNSQLLCGLDFANERPKIARPSPFKIQLDSWAIRINKERQKQINKPHLWLSKDIKKAIYFVPLSIKISKWLLLF